MYRCSENTTDAESHIVIALNTVLTLYETSSCWVMVELNFLPWCLSLYQRTTASVYYCVSLVLNYKTLTHVQYITQYVSSV